jgi:hypothetical protein
MPDNEQVVEPKKKTLTLGLEELQALIAASVSEAVKQSGQTFANAILESRKPYVDPRVKENEDMMRDSFRIAQERMQAEIEASRAYCAHLQGSNALSEYQGQMGSFVLHQLDTGVVVGICTNCQKTIWSNSEDPEELKWFKHKNANRMSRAGQRVFRDPVKAMAAR